MANLRVLLANSLLAYSPLAVVSETKAWFNAGVAALRAGNKAEAEALFLRVVEADEEHEQTDEDQRVCLENVLALNPDNAVARPRLGKCLSAWM